MCRREPKRRRCACRRAFAGEIEAISTVHRIVHGTESCPIVRKVERRVPVDERDGASFRGRP
jgi:hypothetical protein